MKKILILASLDGYANSSRPIQIKKFFKKTDSNVFILNTLNLSRLSQKKSSIFSRFPKLKLLYLLLYFSEFFDLLLNTVFKKFRHYLYYYAVTFQMNLRFIIISKIINERKPDIVICESSMDSKVLLGLSKNIKTIYNCATPLADELYYGNLLTKPQYKKFLKDELYLYKNVDHLSFHWHAYKTYVEKYYYHGKNIFKLDSGCELTKTIAKFSSSPKIAYLGYLGGYWIDIQLLSRLSQIYPYIDVYGSPSPDKKLLLNYKQFANPNILLNYQFGLITVTKDKLRSEGYSAKHLEYLSYGLPVLVPDWRTSTKDIPGTIHYNEENFLEIIREYSEKKRWEKISKEALEYARTQTWDKNLKNLELIINS